MYEHMLCVCEHSVRHAAANDIVLVSVLQSLGLMEVRTVLATLLARFWFELAPSMGKPEQVKKNQQIALTLKIKGGLKLICKAHSHDDKLDRAPAGDLN